MDFDAGRLGPQPQRSLHELWRSLPLLNFSLSFLALQFDQLFDFSNAAATSTPWSRRSAASSLATGLTCRRSFCRKKTDGSGVPSEPPLVLALGLARLPVT
jgi:hypothetical protein